MTSRHGVSTSWLLGAAGFLAGLILTIGAGNTLAQTQDETVARCTNAEPGLRIRSCTALIEAGKLPTDILAAVYMNRGNTYQSLGQHQQAIEDFGQAIKLGLASPVPYYNRGVAYLLLSQWQHAVEDFDQALKLDPRDSGAHINRGVAYQKLEKFDQAIQDFDQATNLNPNATRAIYQRGTTYALKGQYERALQDYSSVIRLAPNEASLYNARGYTYAAMGQYERAIQDYDQALKLAPTLTAASNNRAAAYAKLKEGAPRSHPSIALSQQYGLINPESSALLDKSLSTRIPTHWTQPIIGEDPLKYHRIDNDLIIGSFIQWEGDSLSLRKEVADLIASNGLQLASPDASEAGVVAWLDVYEPTPGAQVLEVMLIGFDRAKAKSKLQAQSGDAQTNINKALLAIVGSMVGATYQRFAITEPFEWVGNQYKVPVERVRGLILKSGFPLGPQMAAAAGGQKQEPPKP